jgi:GDP-L-fucose synthase
MEKTSRIYIAGHRGLVGSAIMRKLDQNGYNKIIAVDQDELDLTNQAAVESFFNVEKPEYVFLAAAKVGGILANSTYPAEFIYQNLAIALNVINASYKYGVNKLLNLGSSCIYPKLAAQPLKEEYILSGPLEPTNEAYAIAKISAIKLCRYYNEQYGTNFISAMPTNLFGPGDNFDLNGSHVLPALIRKFHEAHKNSTDVTLWGDGTPFREFLYSDDLADALLFLMEKYDYNAIGEFINVGVGKEISIKDLAVKVASIIGYEGKVNWDISKPNGTPRKLLDISKIQKLGWNAKTTIDEGIFMAYNDFLKRSNDY